MNSKLKKALAAIFIFCTAHTIVHAEPIKLTYDGKTHPYDLLPINLYINNQPIATTIMPPIQLGERVLVPAREVFEPMGATVEWKADEEKVYVYDQTSLLVLEVNAPEAFVNGQIKLLDMPPKIINDKLMIPIRFISEQLGYGVIWQGETRNVLIDKPVTVPKETLPIPEEAIPVEQTPPTQNLENTLNNISYVHNENTLILEKPSRLSINDISVIDLFRERKIIVNLNGDYSDFFYEGHLVSQEGRIKNVSVSYNGGTQLIIDTFTISAVNIYEVGNQIHIQFVKPSEKYSQIVVIDAGHGGSDPGARSASGIMEKELNIRYAMDVYQLLLNNPHLKVYMTRETDVKPSLQERAIWSNEIGAHLFVSIHNNSINNPAVNGTETFYFSNPDDPRSEYFAKMIQANMVQGLGMTDRKAKAGNGLFVLKNTTMPAVLLEIGFMSNVQDLDKLTQPDFSPRLAQIIYDSIMAYFESGYHLMQ
ncbi:N-acetylmuramoyl-L-alanine amidase [Cellulosilyticum sp. I15G10I2]|uniref:N-acetylmuramoyl-L-alanine amidase n=1 Tax=Cellulosilyticum sp. I15G10I2 TaxID=1892843 RepID=UPI00085C305A|nr:N-acetylmuramoyl-L-alanine amidase [Cellulosilyticum sp. I15G10I2]